MKRLLSATLILMSLFIFALSPAQAQGPYIGEIRMWAGGALYEYDPPSIPDGWALCNGNSLSRTGYANLYAVIGTTFGADDSSTFKLPDLRGRFVVGANYNDGEAFPYYTSTRPEFYPGSVTGEYSHTLTIPEIPSHNHSLSILPASLDKTWTVSAGTWMVPQVAANSTGFTGGGQAHNNVPPALPINFIIYTGNHIATATPTPTATATPTPTFTPTPTGTPIASNPGGIYMPLITTYTQTLQSGNTLVVPVAASFGEILMGGVLAISTLVVVFNFLLRLAYR